VHSNPPIPTPNLDTDLPGSIVTDGYRVAYAAWLPILQQLLDDARHRRMQLDRMHELVVALSNMTTAVPTVTACDVHCDPDAHHVHVQSDSASSSISSAPDSVLVLPIRHCGYIEDEGVGCAHDEEEDELVNEDDADVDEEDVDDEVDDADCADGCDDAYGVGFEDGYDAALIESGLAYCDPEEDDWDDDHDYGYDCDDDCDYDCDES